jgi:hypothetical protein
MLEKLLAPDLVDIIQAIVRDELGKLRVSEVGIVTSLFAHEASGDKNNYECSVRLRDSGLELHRVPIATGRIGLAAIPNVDDEVLVQFVGGDVHGAVVVGRLYNDVDRSPEAKEKELVYISPDEPDAEIRRAYLEFPNDNKLLLRDEELVLEMGQTTITIKHGGDVEIASNSKLVVTTKSDAKIKSDGDLSLEAGGSVSISAGTDVKVEGLSVAVKGKASVGVEGQASTSIKGPIVNVAGMINFSPS